MKPDTIDRILKYALILFFIYLLIELIRKLLGGSLTTDAIMLGFMSLTVTLIFRISSSLHKSIHKVDKRISNHIAWHKGRES